MNDSSNTRSLPRPTWFSMRYVAAFWAAFAVFITGTNGALAWLENRPFVWTSALVANGLCSLLWTLATPVIVQMARIFPLTTPGLRIRNFLVHLLASMVLVAGLLALFNLMSVWMRPPEEARPGGWMAYFLGTLRFYFNMELFYYWTVVLTFQAHAYFQRARAGELAAAEIREQLTQARLQALKTQIQPHFLFNTLHTIGGLIRLDRKGSALDTLSDFGELMRYSLEHHEQTLVRLGKELAFLRAYLDIEQQRLGERLRVRVEVDDDLKSGLVPSLVLQPLVENVVRHACGNQSAPVQTIISATRDSEDLCLRIIDDGPGLPAGWNFETSAGIGLRNTADRLRYLYGERHRFRIERRKEGGVAVELALPWQVEEA